MRLDARTMPSTSLWKVYDVARCMVVKNAVWVDDELARWGRYAPDHTVEEVQERRITIFPARRLVLFNMLDGVEHDTNALGLPAVAPPQTPHTTQGF